MVFALTALIFVSCRDFFSNSWAPWAARDPDKLVPSVTTGNVDELIEMAENNPDLSLAVLKKIKDAAEGASGESKQKLQSAALDAAVNSVGLGQAILGAAGDLSSVKTQEDAEKLVISALDSMANLQAAGSLLFDILPPAPGVHDDPNDPQWDEFNAFTEYASADSLALAAAMILAGEMKNAPDGDYEKYIDEFADDPNKNEELAMAMAFAAALEGREDELTGPLKNVLEGLNLIKVDARAPVINIQPEGAGYSVGDTPAALTVSASVSDGGVLSYQWYSNGTDSNSGGTSLGGAQTDSYTPDTSVPGTVYYYVVITNTNTGATGNTTATETSVAVAIIVN